MTALNKQALIAKIKKQTESFDTVVLKEDEANALLDELEAVQKTSAARLEAIDRTHKMFQRERDRADAAEKRIASLQSENEYIRNRYKELDLLIGKNILVMQAAVIEWQATGDAKNGLAWIYNTLFGPGELPDESEKDAQAYFDREYAPLDKELIELHQWFWERHKRIESKGLVIQEGAA